MIEDAEREGMPYVVFVAKDKMSLYALREYLARCVEKRCNQDHISGVVEIIHDFDFWQDENPDKVKMPD